MLYYLSSLIYSSFVPYSTQNGSFHRLDRGAGGSRGNLSSGRPAHPRTQMPSLPSTWRNRADAVLDLRNHAPVGEGDQSRRADTQDASMARRSALRAFL